MDFLEPPCGLQVRGRKGLVAMALDFDTAKKQDRVAEFFDQVWSLGSPQNLDELST